MHTQSESAPEKDEDRGVAVSFFLSAVESHARGWWRTASVWISEDHKNQKTHLKKFKHTVAKTFNFSQVIHLGLLEVNSGHTEEFKETMYLV